MKYLFILLLSLCAITYTSAQTPQLEAVKMMESDEFEEEALRDVEWLTDKIIQVGSVQQGKPVTVVYRLKNTSDTPLEILEVKSTCTCSVSKYTEGPIAKGEEGVIEATFDAKEAGAFFKAFMLITNRSTTPNVLVIEGMVE